jgi:hypothetical protein
MKRLGSLRKNALRGPMNAIGKGMDASAKEDDVPERTELSAQWHTGSRHPTSM